jgi:hypothetical protein
MILEAQAFSPIHGMAPHPPPLPSACVSPPLFGTKGGGGGQHSNAGEGGGANSDDWRESLALCLLCLCLTDEN